MLIRGKLEICPVWGKNYRLNIPSRTKETETIMVLLTEQYSILLCRITILCCIYKICISSSQPLRITALVHGWVAFIHHRLLSFMQGGVGPPGKRGPAGIGPGNTLRLGESYAICDLYTAGTIRYNRTFRVLQFCNGEEWLTTALETKGRLKHRPGKSCRDILESGQFFFFIQAIWVRRMIQRRFGGSGCGFGGHVV